MVGDTRQQMDWLRRLGAEAPNLIVYPDGRMVASYLGGWEKALRVSPETGRWFYERITREPIPMAIRMGRVWLRPGER